MAILGKLRTVDSFKIPGFRIYFGSRLCDAAAMNMRQISLLLLMYQLTNSATLLGALALARAIPLILVTPFGGAVADRVSKKFLIQISGLVAIVTTLGTAICLTTGYLSAENTGSWWVLIAAAFIDGISTSFKGPSGDALIIEVVGQDLITNAVAVNQIGQSTLRLVGPAIAGVLIDSYGYEPVYYATAAIFLGSVIFMAFLPASGKVPVNQSNLFLDIRDVGQYVRKEINILLILSIVFAAVFFSMPYQQLLPVFTEDILKVGASGLGLLQAFTGIGAIAGSIIIATLPKNKGRGTLLLWSVLILGMALAAFSFSRSWYLSLFLMILVGIGQAGRMTLPLSLLQYYAKPEFRGRIMSFYGVEMGLSSFGSFFAAILSDTMGVQWSVGGLAIILVLATVVAMIFMPRIRKLD